MVGKGSGSRPQNPQANAKQSFTLNKGKSVEVGSDDAGFRGAWYSATIVDIPPKSASKSRKKVMVEYKALINDDSSPLVEYVDPALIRPLPPDDSRRVFQVNDVVDAGYRDGWWTGVVRKVLEGSRYRVYFDNPPDVIDFDGKVLRSHWEWTNGNWVSSDKQVFQQTTGSIFSSGTDVEVKIVKENACDAWFPAVVIKENEDGTFLVKYQNYGNIDEAGNKESVLSSHIRPIPPRYVDRNYELLEKVDVPYNSGWRPGLITKLLAGRGYKVFFKQENVDKDFNHSEIRPHAEWVNGQWICKSEEVLVASDTTKQFDSALDSAGKPDMSLKLETYGTANGKTKQKTPSPTLKSVKNLLEKSTQCNGKSSSHVLPPSKKAKLAASASTVSRSAPSKNLSQFLDVPVTVSPLPLTKTPIESPEDILRDMTSPRTYAKRSRKTPMVDDMAAAQTKSLGEKRTVASQVDKQLIRIKELPEKSMRKKSLGSHRQTLDFVTQKGRSPRMPSGSLQATEKVKTTTPNESEDKNKEAEIPLVIALEASEENRTLNKSLNDLAGEKIAGLNQQTPGGSSQRRKRGRPCRLVINPASDTGKDNGNDNVADKISLGEKAIDQASEPIQKVGECTVSQAALKARATEISEKDRTINEVDIIVPDMVDEDQPLSTWIGGMHSSEDLPLSSFKTEKRKRDLDQEIIPDKNHCFPFVKKSMVWKTIESMEVFKMVPQRPHFRPLADCKEEYREGSAIGAMVTFATLFDNITSLKFDDSKSILESTLESLADLERHGFDVTIPRDRVNQLLSIKDGHDKLEIETKDAENKIKEHSIERTKLDANRKDIEKKIAELQEQLAVFKSKMEVKDCEIARLQTHMDSANVQINKARSKFEKVASAPWKFP